MGKDYRKISKNIIYSTIGFAIFTIALFSVNRLSTININSPVDTSLLADFSTIVGGLATATLTIASIYLIIQTINEQQTSFAEQQTYFKKNEVEQRVFEFIKLYRDNVNEASGKGYEGRNLFIMIRNEILDAIYIVEKHLTSDADYNLEFISNIERIKIDIAFMLVYFGSNSMTDEYLLKTFQNDYCTKEKAENIINEVKGIYNKIKENNEAAKTDQNKAYIYLPFDGHQSRLGHYFRHLYHTITYIDNLPNELYSANEKYKYVKMLRGQISSHEQAIFFFNSISRFGTKWETVKEGETENLITRYHLIKNIRNGFTGKIKPEIFYPNIDYEDIDKKTV